jgi:hypothetical protein
MFSPDEVEKLIEQAYLNGISAGAISKMKTGSYASSEDYKKSAAYSDFFMKVRRNSEAIRATVSATTDK